MAICWFVFLQTNPLFQETVTSSGNLLDCNIFLISLLHFSLPGKLKWPVKSNADFSSTCLNSLAVFFYFLFSPVHPLCAKSPLGI